MPPTQVLFFLCMIFFSACSSNQHLTLPLFQDYTLDLKGSCEISPWCLLTHHAAVTLYTPPYSSNNPSQFAANSLSSSDRNTFIFPPPPTPHTPELRARVEWAAGTLSNTDTRTGTRTDTRTGMARIWFGAGVTPHTVSVILWVSQHVSLSIQACWMLSRCNSESVAAAKPLEALPVLLYEHEHRILE